MPERDPQDRAPVSPDGGSRCPACGSGELATFARFTDGTFHRCRRCGLLFAPDLALLRHDGLQRSAVVGALQPLRELNFARILDRLAPVSPERKRLLEVGSSTGMFLELARRRGFDVYGIEPDAFFVDLAARRYPDLTSRTIAGYFPDACPEGTFDVICFNDVFEHIPDAPSIMTSSRDRLAPGGFLSLSIPASEGFFFRVATLAHRVGFHYPLVRMLQLEFPFPHLYYFGVDSMRALAERLGLEMVSHAPLQILTADTIEARFAMDLKPITGLGIRVAMAKALFAAYQLMPPGRVRPDLLHFLLRRRG